MAHPTTARGYRSSTTAKYKPALLGPDVGDVRYPLLIRRRRGEVLYPPVRSHRQVVPGLRGGLEFPVFSNPDMSLNIAYTGFPRPNPVGGFIAVQCRHLAIHEHEAIPAFAQSLQAGESVAHRIGGIPQPVEEGEQQFAVDGAVVGHQNPARTIRRGANVFRSDFRFPTTASRTDRRFIRTAFSDGGGRSIFAERAASRGPPERRDSGVTLPFMPPTDSLRPTANPVTGKSSGLRRFAPDRGKGGQPFDGSATPPPGTE